MANTDDRKQLRRRVLAAADAFCNAFAQKKSVDEVLSHFSSDGMAFEHGLPELAPFLGRAFKGRKGLEEYFGLLSSTLSYDNMRFSNYVVDVEVLKVSVRGEATFTWQSTTQSWDEVFTYVLQLDDGLKVKVYEIWADSGAAYLASRGELKKINHDAGIDRE